MIGKQVAHGIMPHGTAPIVIKIEGQFEISRETFKNETKICTITFSSQLQFVWMKTSLVAYNCGELHKKLEIKIAKYGYVRGCPKRPATQIGLLEILGV